MRAARIFQHHARVFDVLGFPLALEDYQPGHRVARASIQNMAQEWLRVPHKTDFAPRESALLPQQPQQAIALRAAGGIAMATCRKDQAAFLRRGVS
jgi:hypothetical protein